MQVKFHDGLVPFYCHANEQATCKEGSESEAKTFDLHVDLPSPMAMRSGW